MRKVGPFHIIIRYMYKRVSTHLRLLARELQAPMGAYLGEHGNIIALSTYHPFNDILEAERSRSRDGIVKSKSLDTQTQENVFHHMALYSKEKSLIK